MLIKVMLITALLPLASFASGNINPSIRFKRPKAVASDEKCKEGEALKDCMARIEAAKSKTEDR